METRAGRRWRKSYRADNFLSYISKFEGCQGPFTSSLHHIIELHLMELPSIIELHFMGLPSIIELYIVELPSIIKLHLVELYPFFQLGIMESRRSVVVAITSRRSSTLET